MDSFASFRVGNGYGVMLEDSSWNLYRFAIGAGLTSVSWEVGPTSVSSASSEGLWLSDMAFQTAKTFGDEISYDGYLVSTDANAPWKSVVLEDAIAVFSPELASGHGGTYVQFLVDGPGEFAWRLSSNQGSQVVELDGQEFECNCEDGSILVGMGRHTMRFPIVPGSDPGTEVVLENIKYSPREPPKLDSETMPMEYHQWLDAEGYQGDRSPYFDSTGDGISLLMSMHLGYLQVIVMQLLRQGFLGLWKVARFGFNIKVRPH